MAKKGYTIKQKVIIYGAMAGGGSGHCCPGGSGPGNTPSFTFITDEQGNPITSESNALLVTENTTI